MKRLLAAILMLCTLVSLLCAARAEETQFTLREGLYFGATADEVKAAERLVPLTGGSRIGYGTLQYAGTIAGIDNAIVGYYFDQEGTLNEMFYRFSPTSLAKGYEMFDYLYEFLTEKYGQPLEDQKGSYRVVSGTITKGAGPWVKCREWLISTNDGYVKIDLVMSNREIVPGLKFDGNIVRFVWIDYTSFSKDEVTDLLEKYEKDKNEILSDL